MDNPGMSLFQGPDIHINNSNNIEEEEDLEDQLRRKEELQNLLQANLDDFKYEDSTINSSPNVSVISNNNLDQLYKEAITPDEQLKVLYEVRCRELQALKSDYDKLKIEKEHEIDSQKNQKLLLEAELRQLQISLKNSENLLVDKNETIKVLKKDVTEKDLELNKFSGLISKYEEELSAYKSEVADLHVKLQSQKGPFNLDAKYNSEELKKSLQNKIDQLQSSVEAAAIKFDICNKEKNALQDEVERLISEKIALENDNSAIFRSFEAAQKQCRELIEVIEMLKNENDHFKARLSEKNSEFMSNISLENNQNEEKLKRMLVDKSVELDSLKVKLRFYEADLHELSEYRQLKAEIWKKDFHTCDNPSHTKDFLVLQNELKNYKTLIEDKNRQISSLHCNNKDLKEKIEEMLVQTRSEIQNISLKYSLPQLELMKQELEKAESQEKRLQEKLEESEERRLSLLKTLENKSNEKNTEALLSEVEKCRNDLRMVNQLLANEQEQNRLLAVDLEYKKNELFHLKSELEEAKLQHKKLQSSLQLEKGPVKDDYEALKTQLRNVMQHLEKKSSKEAPQIVQDIITQMDGFLEEVQGDTVEKGVIEEKIGSWKKMLEELQVESNEALQRQYTEAVMKVKELERMVQELKDRLAEQENENRGLNVNLEKAAEDFKLSLKKKDEEIVHLKSVQSEVEPNLLRNLDELKEKLKSKEGELTKLLESIKNYEREKKETKKWLDKVKKEMDRVKEENAMLNEKLRCIDIKKGAEKLVESDGGGGGDAEAKRKETDLQVLLEEEMVKCELKLRDELQIEYQKRISDIEKLYQKTFKETNDLCKQQKAELEVQDKKFRDYLKVFLTESEACKTRLESEKLELLSELQLLRGEFDKYKTLAGAREEKYFVTLKKLEKESRRNNEAWKEYSKKVVCSCLDIEATNKKVRDRILENMDRYDREVEHIREMVDAKLARKASKKEKS